MLKERLPGLNATLPLPPFPLKLVVWLLTPAFFGALALPVAAVARIRRRTRPPALPRMCTEWLRTHDADAGHRSEFWSKRW